MIRTYSKKRAADMRLYSQARRYFLDKFPVCRVCRGNATDVHHMKGRTGALLLDPHYWLPVCRVCHQKIEDNPEWAKRMGYSVERIGNL